MMKLLLGILLILATPVTAAEQFLVLNAPRHVRSGDEREWDEFPRTCDGRALDLLFNADANVGEWTLELRQQDIRRTWTVMLNDQSLGRLVIDENDQLLHLSIPAGTLVNGPNRLLIKCTATPTDPSDDVRIGPIRILDRPPAAVGSECTINVRVLDAPDDLLVPARITIATEDGTLVPVTAQPADHTAVRTGCVYTGNGSARLKLPAGKYILYASRGFEYSIDRQTVTLEPDCTHDFDFHIRRVVATEGYIACDTHVHSRTHSGHGDSTVQERMITLAGEGVELPIATDHNVQINHEPFAREAGVRQWFTPVIGNEVTTKQGHFNIFPISADALTPDHTVGSWAETFASIAETTGARVTILNHARDVHSGTRPFGPRLHNALVGENLQGWPIGFNAMEVINSGATQTETLQLLHDWMGLLNAGHRITPIGSSDSHDVNRYIVGQGRTYIRVDDSDPSAVNVTAAAQAVAEGRILVSYGLLVDLTVNGQFHSGDTVPAADSDLHLHVRVQAPEWSTPRKVLLFANGQLWKEVEVPADTAAETEPGLRFSVDWTFPHPKHDLFLTAIAVGDGIDEPYWPTAKPYQPTSPHWEPQTLACSGAVFIDADGDREWTSPRVQAQRLVDQTKNDPAALVRSLAAYDAAVAAQAAHLYRLAGGDLDAAPLTAALKTASESTRQGFADYAAAWRENQVAQFE